MNPELRLVSPRDSQDSHMSNSRGSVSLDGGNTIQGDLFSPNGLTTPRDTNPLTGASLETSKNVDYDLPFTFDEKKNLFFFVLGIVCFKFSYECLNVCVSLLTFSKFPSSMGKIMWAVIGASFNLSQCVASIAVAQLIRQYSMNRLLVSAVTIFGSLALMILIIEAATGGSLVQLGTWPPELIFLFYIPMGGCFGVLEVLRRVAPHGIIGESPHKLERIAAIIHIFYELSATGGAFASTPLIIALGPAYALLILPIGFFLAAGFYWHVKFPFAAVTMIPNQTGISEKFRKFFRVYGNSVYFGAKFLFLERRYIWIVPCYIIPLAFHYYIKLTVFPLFANYVLQDGTDAGIMLGATNLGSLVGALLVLVLGTYYVPTPIPWVRSGALTLLVMWIFPFMDVNPTWAWAWAASPLLMASAAGFSSGDVTLTAYIQATAPLTHLPVPEGSSALGSAMAFLYSCFVLVFTGINIGMVFLFGDFEIPRTSMIWMMGVLGTVFSGVVFFSDVYSERFALDKSERNFRDKSGT